MAEEARSPAAARWTLANWSSASATPKTRIPTKTSRRSSRSRVSVVGEISPRVTTAARLAPRRARARSTIQASAIATSTVAIAVTTSPWSLKKPAATGTIAGGMRTEGSFKAVLLDGMGTLVRLVPPAPALASALGVPLDVAERAFAAEVAFYLEHQLEGSGAAEVEDLRRRCASVVASTAGVDPVRAYDALMGSLRFEAYEDAAPALTELRARGLRLVVVSNWDASLPEVLAEVGLAHLVDDVVVSAVTGFSKP